jgi:hypothetical protein
MVLAINTFKNKTSFSIDIENTENLNERSHVNPNQEVRKKMWLAQVSDGSKGILIKVTYPGGAIHQLLYMWDYDWNLRYIKNGNSNTNYISVNGNKDFDITLDTYDLIFECRGRTFTGNISKVYWRNWYIDMLSSKPTNFLCDSDNFKLLAKNLPVEDNKSSMETLWQSAACTDLIKFIFHTPKLYSVGWLPYLADWKNAIITGKSIFKYHDPADIDGVGIILGQYNGIIYGSNLKNKICEEIVQHPENKGHYSWVLEPKNGNIIYKWNSELGIETKNYTRHSELNTGEPVICAGEFYIKGGNLYKLYIELNDSSGHYKPDGKECLPYVLQKFKDLGIEASLEAEYYTRNAEPALLELNSAEQAILGDVEGPFILSHL